nr:unnamed protein product [Callosobruchus analis]
MVGDEAYLLKTYLVRPYPSGNLSVQKTIFNKRLSRARVTIECSFAILSNKCRCFYEVQDIIGCTTNLENRNSTSRSRCNNRASSRAPSIRDQYKNYFVNNLM